MKITRAADYAIRCVLHLAKKPPREVVSRREVAEAMDIPVAFLGKIAQGLAKAGLVVVRQGAKGGYQLAKPPGRITLLDVVEALDGEIEVNDCLARPEECGRMPSCRVHRALIDIRTALRRSLEAVTFEDLAKGDECPGTAAWRGSEKTLGCIES